MDLHACDDSHAILYHHWYPFELLLAGGKSLVKIDLKQGGKKMFYNVDLKKMVQTNAVTGCKTVSTWSVCANGNQRVYDLKIQQQLEHAYQSFTTGGSRSTIRIYSGKRDYVVDFNTMVQTRASSTSLHHAPNTAKVEREHGTVGQVNVRRVDKDADKGGLLPDTWNTTDDDDCKQNTILNIQRACELRPHPSVRRLPDNFFCSS